MSRKLLLFIILSLGFTSLISYTEYNVAPTNVVFELFFLISACIAAKRFSLNSSLIFTISIGYFLLCYVYACIWGEHSSFDFILAYKTFLYLPFICLLSNKILISSHYLNLIFKVLLSLFLLKYLLWLAFSISSRPGVFVENNFELIFLLCIALTFHFKYRSLNKFEYLALVAIFLLSGSRSGLLALLFALTVINVSHFDFRTVLKVFLLSIVGIAVVFVIANRMGEGGIESIDRFVFLQSFIYSISDWEVINYLFGSQPITPLADVICNRLSYYETLFSQSKPGVCYSVILHSYILRLLFDHGLLGLIFVFVSLWLILGASNVDGRFRISIIGIIGINSLSVSGFNSIYIVLGIFIAMCSSTYCNKNHVYKNNFYK
jgi:hypothetical protein